MSDRRIKNELKKMSDFETVWEREKHIVSIVLPSQCIVSFHHLQHYPFKPPRIYVNAAPYGRFLHLCSSRLRTTYQKWFPLDCCLRCESFDCDFRWNVMCNFTSVIEEIKQFARKKWLVYRLFQMEPCFRRSHIPDDLVREIVSYIYKPDLGKFMTVQ